VAYIPTSPKDVPSIFKVHVESFSREILVKIVVWLNVSTTKVSGPKCQGSDGKNMENISTSILVGKKETHVLHLMVMPRNFDIKFKASSSVTF